MVELALYKNVIERPSKVYVTVPSISETEYYKNLIVELINRRHAMNLSQEKLNQIIGVSDGLVNKWESGVRLPSSFYLMCWCRSLNLVLTTKES